MTTARIEIPPKLIPVFEGVRRVRGAYGGRGSAKTRTFAIMSAVRAYMFAEHGARGVILCAREWMNSLRDSSMSEVKSAIESIDWLADYFEIGQDYIRTKNRRVEYAFTGLNRNLNSLKSKSRILIAWVDEAEGVSDTAWDKLEPTIREEGSELWVTWNPEMDGSATDLRFRKWADQLENNSLVVEVNYPDNPFFPATLDDLRKRHRRTMDPNTYAWIWDGAYLENSNSQVLNGKYRIDTFEPEFHWDGPYYGLDYGFSQDPTACVELWINDGTLYISREAGGVGVDIDLTPDMLKTAMPGIENHVVRADNARPESTSYLKRHGLPRVESAPKWAGSVEDGIAYLRSFDEIVIHPRCAEVTQEARKYRYKVDKNTGDVTATVLDKHNHYMDAIRYALAPMIRRDGNFGFLPRKRR